VVAVVGHAAIIAEPECTTGAWHLGLGSRTMSDAAQAFRRKAALAVAKIARGSGADNADRHIRMADAVIAEFAKPTEDMIDAAYEAVRFDEAWAINSRRDFVKAVKAMVRSVLGKNSPA